MSQPQKTSEKTKPKAEEAKPADKPKDAPKPAEETKKTADPKATENPKTDAEKPKAQPKEAGKPEPEKTKEQPKTQTKEQPKEAEKPKEQAKDQPKAADTTKESDKLKEQPKDQPKEQSKPGDKTKEAAKPTAEPAKPDGKKPEAGKQDSKSPDVNDSKGHNDSYRDSSQHSLSPDGNQIMNKPGLPKRGLSPLAGGKRSIAEELNLRMKDTYSSPALGMKYSHEKLMERYNKEFLAAKQERHREILEKIKDKTKPMDHENLHKHEMEYMSNKMKEKELRRAEMERQLYEFNHNEFNPHKSRAYYRIANEEVANPRLEKLEKAKKALETRKQYSDIVKDIFFKDALLAGRNAKSQHMLKSGLPEITSRDPREEADRKKREEFEKLKLRNELGDKYLMHVRQINEKIPLDKRKEMDMKRFQPKEVPKKMKSRKYLDDIARKFEEPKDVVFQKDLIKKLKPDGTDSKNALIENIKNHDTNMKLREVRMRFNADSKHQVNGELGDVYINSIESKLKILDNEIKLKEGKKKVQPQEDTYGAQSYHNDYPDDNHYGATQELSNSAPIDNGHISDPQDPNGPPTKRSIQDAPANPASGVTATKPANTAANPTTTATTTPAQPTTKTGTSGALPTTTTVTQPTTTTTPALPTATNPAPSNPLATTTAQQQQLPPKDTTVTKVTTGITGA